MIDNIAYILIFFDTHRGISKKGAKMLINMDLMEIIGIISALLTLSAFIMNQYGVLCNDDIRYDAMNMFSGVGLVVYAVSIHGIPFILTNSVWAVVSGIDVTKYLLKKWRGVKSVA